MKKMKERTNSLKKRSLSICLVLCLVFSAAVCARSNTAEAKSTSAIFNSVKSAYGSSFPLSDKNMIKTKRKNIFGKYSTIMGVSAKYFSSYTAALKSNSKKEYMCFICKATSAKKVKTIKNKLKKYVVSEYKGNLNYHSAEGNKILKNAKVGSKGKYVYLFALDTSGNKKAIEAFKSNF
ncbi:MAG: DUF4358 domain-containing protein [Eubacterium sp.]|nr:DUF4358 domain-containing protein [Eubacterium sp.]